MQPTVESLCNQMAKFRILSNDDIRTMRNRWLGHSKTDAADVGKFCNWMVSQKYLSEFQSALLRKGSPEQLFFDQYLLLDRIGQGRMAGVYKAVHQGTDQSVAIKILPPSKAPNAQLLARFQREARMAIRLDHPNVVRTFDQGRTKSGLNYLVMEYLDGESLDEVLKRRKTVSITEAVHVGVQALEGLQHVFEEGLVHRDVKPGNIMLVPGWKPGQDDSMLPSTVKLLDIGLGRAMFDEGIAGLPESPDLTTEGSILGTPNYMAPEQARSARTADIRADIYSMGCVIYEMLSGAPPFADPNFMKQILRHATEAPRPLKELYPAVPDALWQVIQVMLAKDSAQRYSTPQQASRALQTVLPDKQELPKSPPPSPKLRSYLTWLATDKPETLKNERQDRKPPVPLVSKQEPAKPVKVSSRKTPVPKSPLPVHPTDNTAIPEAVVKPKPTAASPAATPPAQQPTKPRDDIPKAQPVAPGKVPLPAKPASAEKSSETRHTFAGKLASAWQLLNVTPRDCIVAGIGAGLLLILEGIIWLLIWLFGG